MVTEHTTVPAFFRCECKVVVPSGHISAINTSLIHDSLPDLELRRRETAELC